MGLTTEEPPATTGQARSTDATALRSRIAACVRDLRGRSGHSLAEVAAAAGIGKSTLHAIEAGVANPGIETLWALARALGVPFGALLEQPQATTRVVRAAEAPRIASESSAMQALLLTTTSHGARVEVYALELGLRDDPTARSGTAPTGADTASSGAGRSSSARVTAVSSSDDAGGGDVTPTGPVGPGHAASAHSPGTVEHVIVTSGRLLVGPAQDPVELAAGDLVSFPGDVPHRYQPLEPATRAVLLIEYT